MNGHKKQSILCIMIKMLLGLSITNAKCFYIRGVLSDYLGDEASMLESPECPSNNT